MTENAKRVKMLTSKWHREKENFITHYFRSLKYIRLVKNILVGIIGKGGLHLRLFPLLRPKDVLIDQICTWPIGSRLDQNCNCTTKPWGQQHETINMSLQYSFAEETEEHFIVYGHTDVRSDGRTMVSHELD